MTLTAALLLAVSFIIKIPACFVPLTGYFGSYQATNAMMAEMMPAGGHWLSLVMPRTFLIMGNQPGLHLLYYPFAALFSAAAYTLLGGSFVFWGRMQAALFAFGAGLLWNRCLSRFYPEIQGRTAAALIFNFSPMFLIAGLGFQNEAAALFFLVSSFYLLHKSQNIPSAAAAGVLFSLAVTARLHFILAGPAFLFVLWQKKSSVLRFLTFMFFCASVFAAWVGWTWVLQNRFPEQVATSFFTQSGEGRVMTASLLTSSSFYVRILKIMAGSFMTPAGFLLLFWGFYGAARETRVFTLWLAGTLGVIFLLPQKVMDHPFYLLAALPPAAVFAGRGLERLRLRFPKFFIPAVVLFFLLSLRYYMPPAFSTDGGAGIPAAGEIIRQMTGPQDRVIAAHGTSNDLLYYASRMGWTFDLKMAHHPLDDQERHKALKLEGYGDPAQWLETLRRRGARYLAVADPEIFREEKTFYDYVAGRYRSLQTGNPALLIYDLGEKS